METAPSETVADLQRLIRVARGEEPADLLLTGARLVNVLTGEIYPADVAISGGWIAGVGDSYRSSRETLRLDGLYLLPGLIDAHVHVESSMLSPPEFARAVLPHGTTTIICDPHEMANVLGFDGVRYILQSSEKIPLNVFVTASSCVPATQMETSGASFSGKEIETLLRWNRVIGLAEMMNVPGILAGLPEEMEKLRVARGMDRPIDGHAPLLSGKDLNAYIAAGVRTDHETGRIEEALEKLRLGMILMIREGSAARNLADLLPVVTPENSRRCLLVSDDTHPRDLYVDGHLDHSLRKAVGLGLDPMTAIRMVTLNPAEAFRLRGLGAVAPGYRADVTVMRDLRGFQVERVIKDGRVAASGGRLTVEIPHETDDSVRNTMRVKPFRPEDLRLHIGGNRARVIGLTPDQLYTRHLIEEVIVEDGYVRPDLPRDILKLAVIERHKATGNIGLGLVQGFGLREGAVASSVAHDSHNIIVVGTNDRDMWEAAQQLITIGGGHVVISNGAVRGLLPLPIAGLLSDRPVEEVISGEEEILTTIRKLGVVLSSPFLTLSFLALPVIPELKLTDKGLVDVSRFMPVSIEP
jgi:adenine deaminase